MSEHSNSSSDPTSFNANTLPTSSLADDAADRVQNMSLNQSGDRIPPQSTLVGQQPSIMAQEYATIISDTCGPPSTLAAFQTSCQPARLLPTSSAFGSVWITCIGTDCQSKSRALRHGTGLRLSSALHPSSQHMQVWPSDRGNGGHLVRPPANQTGLLMRARPYYAHPPYPPMQSVHPSNNQGLSTVSDPVPGALSNGSQPIGHQPSHTLIPSQSMPHLAMAYVHGQPRSFPLQGQPHAQVLPPGALPPQQLAHVRPLNDDANPQHQIYWEPRPSFRSHPMPHLQQPSPRPYLPYPSSSSSDHNLTTKGNNVEPIVASTLNLSIRMLPPPWLWASRESVLSVDSSAGAIQGNQTSIDNTLSYSAQDQSHSGPSKYAYHKKQHSFPSPGVYWNPIHAIKSQARNDSDNTSIQSNATSQPSLNTVDKTVSAPGNESLKQCAKMQSEVKIRTLTLPLFILADCYGSGALGLAIDHDKAFPTILRLQSKTILLLHTESQSLLKLVLVLVAILIVLLNTTVVLLFGDTAAMFKLGMIQIYGTLGQQQNPREGVTLLKRAAEQADETSPNALHELAILYEGEILGSQISIAWYTKAAEQGDPDAELALSGWYLTGADGILKQSDQEAYLWARKAADKGLAKAEYAVGYFVEHGVGIRSDMDEARKWYMRSAGQGNKRAIQRLKDFVVRNQQDANKSIVRN
ncbi:hypothetical protein BSLG_005686 [Batrachochytrium salamandrivorans]|nr:hypothetical protein BSLG_005686 [Batrachochytrium salamandrivorans]